MDDAASRVAIVEATGPVTVAQLRRSITALLTRAGVDSPDADARWLVRHGLELSAVELIRDAARTVEPARVAAVRRLAQRRAGREPLQLVLGSTEFRGHHLIVRPGTFVPRPETELLTEHALACLPDGGTVVEPCTGTGAIACAIAAERPCTRVVATDIDPAAADLARDNAAALGVVIDVRVGDLLAPVPTALRGAVDVLVANPPYVADAELASLPPEVTRWDPRRALVAGASGHEVTDRLFALATTWLTRRGWLLVELDESRATEAARRAAAAGLEDVVVLDDLTGRPRFVRARRP